MDVARGALGPRNGTVRRRKKTTLDPDPQDDNKNTDLANIPCSITFEVFQKHTFFRINHL